LGCLAGVECVLLGAPEGLFGWCGARPRAGLVLVPERERERESLIYIHHSYDYSDGTDLQRCLEE
jgi:hypothetical protein